MTNSNKTAPTAIVATAALAGGLSGCKDTEIKYTYTTIPEGVFYNEPLRLIEQEGQRCTIDWLAHGDSISTLPLGHHESEMDTKLGFFSGNTYYNYDVDNSSKKIPDSHKYYVASGMIVKNSRVLNDSRFSAYNAKDSVNSIAFTDLQEITKEQADSLARKNDKTANFVDEYLKQAAKQESKSR